MSKKKWNADINQAPYGETLEVINDLMDKPVLATKGYCAPGTTVHANQSFFTSVYTPDDLGGFSAGQLVIPNKWRKP